MQCCLSEKGFNPFYRLLAEKMLATDSNQKYTFKFVLWDYLKAIASLEIE